ncbi:MAG: hypothetical protein JXR77_03230, partial [Lentisphaeria bacterium]|nr:hypothetical protein [Lentisphaeria bacterium]
MTNTRTATMTPRRREVNPPAPRKSGLLQDPNAAAGLVPGGAPMGGQGEGAGRPSLPESALHCRKGSGGGKLLPRRFPGGGKLLP